MRNPGPYSGIRSPSTHSLPNASLLYGHINATQDPGDTSNHSILQIDNIPFAAYDLVLYLGQNEGQQFDGKGFVSLNDGSLEEYTLITTEPNGTLTEITDPVTPGNYMIFRGLTGSSLKIQSYGDGFTHNGPAGFQLAESTRAQIPVQFTDISVDPSNGDITLTWQSNPGDEYSLCWSEDLINYLPTGNPVISAHPTNDFTTFGPIPTPTASSDKIFFALTEADFVDPTFDRAAGNNSEITLFFSEPMVGVTETSNYTLTEVGGNIVTITGTSPGPTPSSITLNTAVPLNLAANYSITVNNLTDLAGRSLSNSNTSTFKTWDNTPTGVKVFILAGQSNMEGFGTSEAGNSGPGTIGSLRHLVNTNPSKYGSLVDGAGNFTNRSDVKIWWRRDEPGNTGNLLSGDLGIGFGVSNSQFGPEFAFGQIMGNTYSEPVLIVKIAWGGKSLFADYRPPSAVAKRGGSIGLHYKTMLEYTHQVLDDIDNVFPSFSGQGYQIAGFGWHQGFNDQLAAFTAEEYKENLADFIRDIRREFANPSLPFSLATTGQGGTSQSSVRATLHANQLAIADSAQFPEFSGTVTATDTRPFWREANVSPINQGFHWNHNAETYYLIGESIANEMLSILNP